jgi:transposase
LLRAREAGLAVWSLPPGLDDDEVLEQRLFRRMGRPPRDSDEPNWPKVASEMKRKGVTLNLLWQEYREAHPDGYGYTWFCCCKFRGNPPPHSEMMPPPNSDN